MNNEEMLDEYVKTWANLHSVYDNGNQSDWSGVYLFRNRIIITDDYLKSLKEALIFIKTQPLYIKNNCLYIPPYNEDGKTVDDSGEIFCDKLYKHLFEKTKLIRAQKWGTKQNIFVRVEKNFLIKLGLLVEDQHHFTLTTLGEKFINSATISELKNIVESNFIALGWWKRPYPIHPFQLLLKILNSIDGNFITLEEYKFIISHAKSDEQLSDIITHIKTLRLMPHKIDAYNNYIKDNKSEKEFKDFSIKGEEYLKSFAILDYIKYDVKNKILTLIDSSKTKDILIRADQISIDIEKNIKIIKSNIYASINKEKAIKLAEENRIKDELEKIRKNQLDADRKKAMVECYAIKDKEQAEARQRYINGED